MTRDSKSNRFLLARSVRTCPDGVEFDTAIMCLSAEPCQNGGYSIADQMGCFLRCNCPYGFSSPLCEYQCEIKTNYLPGYKLKSLYLRKRIAMNFKATTIGLVLSASRHAHDRGGISIHPCSENNTIQIRRWSHAESSTIIAVRDPEMICDGNSSNPYWIDFYNNAYQVGHIGDPEPILQWIDDQQFSIRYAHVLSEFVGSVEFDIPCSSGYKWPQ
ncbi:uncharacterized protein LOC121432149 [Lytechinus variegatus]|uniref:uncharacterized protein LOC121432149 n=1 Tax=Lytechinus variegatus TaxID=7654 RepID=UPI001BB20E9E|nr:uncharacterized protein LOC121432149 [Lytechinus variegatus]